MLLHLGVLGVRPKSASWSLVCRLNTGGRPDRCNGSSTIRDLSTVTPVVSPLTLKSRIQGKKEIASSLLRASRGPRAIRPRHSHIMSPSEPTRPRVLIWGTGSIGTAYAFVFSRANCHITAICRSNYEVAKSQGFTLSSTLWGTHTFRPDIVARTVEEAISQSCADQQQQQPYDYIVVTAKSLPGSTPTQASQLRRAVTEGHTTIALIQNGIDIEPEYAELYPTNPLLSCVVYLPATQTSPGHVVHKEVERLHIGTYPSTPDSSSHATKAVEQFASLLGRGGATVHIHADVQTERWRKLLVNGSWNPVCALTRCRDAEFLHSFDDGALNITSSSPPTTATETTGTGEKDNNQQQQQPPPLSLIRTVMEEIAAVAAATGHPVPADAIAHQLSRARARSLDAAIEPSMLADALHGRPLEVEAILGNCVRAAERGGVEGQIPTLRTLYTLCRALDGSRWRR